MDKKENSYISSSAFKGSKQHKAELLSELGFRGGSLNLKDLMSSTVLSEDLIRNGRKTQKITALWMKVNGNTERFHTKGTYLHEYKDKDMLPKLIVYVDSHTLLVDFRARREIYKSRLAQAGCRVSEVEFRISNRISDDKTTAELNTVNSFIQDQNSTDHVVEENEAQCSVMSQEKEEVINELQNEYPDLSPELKKLFLKLVKGSSSSNMNRDTKKD